MVHSIIYKMLSHYHFVLINIIYFFPLKGTLKHILRSAQFSSSSQLLLSKEYFISGSRRSTSFWVPYRTHAALGAVSTPSSLCSLITLCRYGWNFSCMGHLLCWEKLQLRDALGYSGVAVVEGHVCFHKLLRQLCRPNVCAQWDLLAKFRMAQDQLFYKLPGAM